MNPDLKVSPNCFIAAIPSPERINNRIQSPTKKIKYNMEISKYYMR